MPINQIRSIRHKFISEGKLTLEGVCMLVLLSSSKGKEVQRFFSYLTDLKAGNLSDPPSACPSCSEKLKEKELAEEGRKRLRDEKLMQVEIEKEKKRIKRAEELALQEERKMIEKAEKEERERMRREEKEQERLRKMKEQEEKRQAAEEAKRRREQIRKEKEEAERRIKEMERIRMEEELRKVEEERRREEERLRVEAEAKAEREEQERRVAEEAVKRTAEALRAKAEAARLQAEKAKKEKYEKAQAAATRAAEAAAAKERADAHFREARRKAQEQFEAQWRREFYDRAENPYAYGHEYEYSQRQQRAAAEQGHLHWKHAGSRTVLQITTFAGLEAYIKEMQGSKDPITEGQIPWPPENNPLYLTPVERCMKDVCKARVRKAISWFHTDKFSNWCIKRLPEREQQAAFAKATELTKRLVIMKADLGV